MYEAINTGLRKGTGKICAYLNCDEQYLPGALPSILRIFSERPQVEIVQGGFLVINERNQLVTLQRPVKLSWPHVATSHLPNFSCATFFRRSLLEDGKAWFDESLHSCADALWNLERIQSGKRFFYFERVVSVFRQTGVNRGLTPQGIEEKKRITRTMPEWVRMGAPFWKLVHRLRKFFAGAYFPKRIRYSIWTVPQESKRTPYGPSCATGIWWDRLRL